MRYYFWIILIPMCLTAYVPVPKHEHQDLGERRIKVLLEKKPLSSLTTYTISSPLGVIAQTAVNEKVYYSKKLTLIAKKGCLYIKADSTLEHLKGRTLTLEPLRGHLSVNGTTYQGALSLIVQASAKKTYLVNTLDLEDYVYAVLPSEIFQSWPKEMHKVQAIATRTYAVHCMQQNKKRQVPLVYDISNTKLHQSYNGLHPHTHMRKAVQETHGKILTHKGKAVLAMFDSCCAGAIPAHMDYHDYDKAPYLARCHPCTFCTSSKLYNWEKEVHLSDFISHMKGYPEIASKMATIGPLVNVTVAELDKAGLVQRLVLKGKRKVIELADSQLYESMRSIFRSLSFKLKRKKNSLVVKGNGFGHQIGLCQYGARELVRRGWDHKSILRFYYPKTRFSRIT